MDKKVICNDIDGGKHEVDVDQISWRPSAYGILIRDNKILLSPQYDGYDFPGGGQEIDETIDEALEREFFEETGLKVKRDKIIACEGNFYYSKNTNEYWNSHLIYYLVNYVSGTLSTAGFDQYEKEYAKIAEWVDLSRIDELKYYNSVDSAAIIKKAVEIKNSLS